MSNLRDESIEGKEKAKTGFEGVRVLFSVSLRTLIRVQRQWATKSPTKTGSTSKGKSKVEADDSAPPLKAGYFFHQPPHDKVVKKEEEEEIALSEDETDQPDPLIPPRSSDDLWNQLSPFPDDAILPDRSETKREENLAAESHYKPFFTGGPSIDSRLELSLPVLAAPADRISFEKSKSTNKGKGKGKVKEEMDDEAIMRDLECPICSLIFKSSVVGFGKHIDQCLIKSTASEESSSSRTTKRAQGKDVAGTVKKRKVSKSEEGKKGKGRRSEAEQGLGRFFK